MSNNAVVPEVPKYFAVLDQVAEKIGDTRKAGAWSLPDKSLTPYSPSQIAAYLEAVFPDEQAKRRRGSQALRLFLAGLLVYVLATILFLWLVLAARPHGGVAAAIALFSVPLFLLSHRMIRNQVSAAKIKGQCLMLAQYAEPEQVPLLIDALDVVDTRPIVRLKLAALLPLYLQTDQPPLTDRLTGELARQLETSFAVLHKLRDPVQIDQNISYLAATLIYFEREQAEGRTLPKTIPPILKRFARSSMQGSSVPEAQWTMLQSATEECLAYVGAGK